LPDSTLETVAFETPARFATSSIVVIVFFPLNLMVRSVLHRIKIVAAAASRFFPRRVIVVTKRRNGQKAILFHQEKLMMIM
jgi:PTS system arbutin/cellobiose/salicin-specific IIC component